MIKEFFGFGGYTREAEGFLSWQHLLFVSSLMLLMVALAIVLGRKYKEQTQRAKNKIPHCPSGSHEALHHSPLPDRNAFAAAPSDRKYTHAFAASLDRLRFWFPNMPKSLPALRG